MQYSIINNCHHYISRIFYLSYKNPCPLGHLPISPFPYALALIFNSLLSRVWLFYLPHIYSDMGWWEKVIYRLPQPVWLRCHHKWPRLGEVFLLQCCGNRLFPLTGETHQVSEALSAVALYSEKGRVGTKLWSRRHARWSIGVREPSEEK